MAIYFWVLNIMILRIVAKALAKRIKVRQQRTPGSACQT